MADIPSVTPATATTPLGSNTPQLSNVPVQQAPATVAAPAQLAGTVVSSNPQTQQLIIQTAQGQILVQSSAALPPNTSVLIDLSASNGQTRATVTVSQQNIPQPQTSANTVQPPDIQTTLPPLQEGSTVTALQLPTAPAMQPISIEQLATSLETLQMSGLQNIRLPLPEQLLQELTKTSSIRDFLRQLPPQLLRDIANYVAAQQSHAPAQENHGILRRLLSAYLPQKSIPDKFAVPAVPENEQNDDNIMQLLRTPLQAKPASPPSAGNNKPAFFSPLTSPIDALIVSSEETSRETSGFSALLRQLLPHGAPESAPAPQNMFHLRILKIMPPETTPAQIKAVLAKMPAAVQTGDVETFASGGQPILKAAETHYAISTPAKVPEGSKIIFEATPMTPEDIVQAGLFATRDSGTAQSSGWPALQEALKALPPATPAAQALKNTLPTPTAHLASTALFFLAALRSGAIGNWLGPNTLQALQQAGKKDLADALSNDFGKLSTQSKDVLPGDWRAISIPLRYENQISQMQFYVRHPHDQEQGEQEQSRGGKPATRFILNLSLSRMGTVQLDGFIQKKNFDIILRTEDKLPFDMRQELMKRFAQGLDQVQMQGGISFQTRQQGWMVPEAGKTAAEA